GDMVTMTLLQGILNTFVIFISRIIAQLVSGLFLSNHNNENENENENENKNNQGNPMIYFMISMVLEVIFGILASIITMWFSRHREFRADAGSAHLVGREKMIAALQRLKTSYEPKETNSMIAFCINGRSEHFSELFLSHPPLYKRIEALHMGTYLN
ncbi:MAG: M48 family metalloprotease, partial [Arsenophonus sp. ET-DL12-MAG3]